MAAVVRRTRRVEAQLREFQLRINDKVDLELNQENDAQQKSPNLPIERIITLKNSIDIFSVRSKEQLDLPPDYLADLILKFRNDLTAFGQGNADSEVPFVQSPDLLWLVAAQAALKTLAIILKTFSHNVFLLNEEIIFWEDVLGSDWYIGIHTLQTSPFNLWRKLKRNHILESLKSASGWGRDSTESKNKFTISLPRIWSQFYDSVRQCLRPEKKRLFFREISSPLDRPRVEIQYKKRGLEAMKNFNASAIGLLLENCLSFGVDDHPPGCKDTIFTSENLRNTVMESVDIMAAALQSVEDKDGLPVLNNDIFLAAGEKVGKQAQRVDRRALDNPKLVVEQLIHILRELLPRYNKISNNATREFGRPTSLVRYWLPLLFGVISGTMSLNLLRTQLPALVECIRDLGSTTIEFWSNWVVDPTWKLIRTIRHDDASEIALISKNSLEADRSSLERMVVDFILDRHESTLSTDAIASKVREGDLTPVLKAYEKDLRSPFVGTVRGDLVRALLIQIQKTKVDVEIAMSGIDALLKSQELVFGFVGLTPGILVSYASIRWLYGIFGNRKGFRMGRQQDDLRYALRNIHRSLTSSIPTSKGLLTYRNHGLLVCNIEILLRKAEIVLQGEDLLAFKEDISDLINENHVDRQLRIVERMTWTYSKWT